MLREGWRRAGAGAHVPCAAAPRACLGDTEPSWGHSRICIPNSPLPPGTARGPAPAPVPPSRSWTAFHGPFYLPGPLLLTTLGYCPHLQRGPEGGSGHTETPSCKHPDTVICHCTLNVGTGCSTGWPPEWKAPPHLWASVSPDVPQRAWWSGPCADTHSVLLLWGLRLAVRRFVANQRREKLPGVPGNLLRGTQPAPPSCSWSLYFLLPGTPMTCWGGRGLSEPRGDPTLTARKPGS